MSSNKTAIVTGASSGLGFAIAKAFLDLGYNVVGNARTQERLDAAHAELGNSDRFLGVAGDISLPETAERLLDHALEAFGKVDVLVNNAGIFVARDFIDFTAAEIDAVIDTNLRGFIYPTQVVARHMVSRNEGSIVNVTASVGMQPDRNVPGTMAVLTKGGLNAVTRGLSIELSRHNVRVNAVAPGVIDTPMHSPETHEFLSALNPAGRLGTPEEIAEAVVYLAQASFINGVVLPVDGGGTAGRW
ncbi:NAD(P)-dependent dehydrogenase (short-subunit alcohol dehydrogenase family) [Luteibacter sp. OK325]|jgi:NAD(P)-dependent dehydrogenase (short-subunit alcohol dehydrogenase family)|uniref:SDR family NAD(P)-dependent oxidoreductase n=1 Tax=Luteibacter sp. OK325 TaxID=2135670 RepID=UPI000D34328A|nr:SDR family oxidoreductase [Luteibacter sp. OK325]PTR32825.1 NAD(P)-dependent dehydrogenase (short-subunit alcohol dehydrogenase family) [Luteibacter sp. OK325]